MEHIFLFEKKTDLGVDEGHRDPVIIEESTTPRSELVDLGDDRLEGKLVADPSLLLRAGHNRSSPDQRHPVLGVLGTVTI